MQLIVCTGPITTPVCEHKTSGTNIQMLLRATMTLIFMFSFFLMGKKKHLNTQKLQFFVHCTNPLATEKLNILFCVSGAI